VGFLSDFIGRALWKGFFECESPDANAYSPVRSSIIARPTCAIQLICYPSEHRIQSFTQHFPYEWEILLVYLNTLSGPPRASPIGPSGIVEKCIHGVTH
jgi:hypothetical protein